MEQRHLCDATMILRVGSFIGRSRRGHLQNQARGSQLGSTIKVAHAGKGRWKILRAANPKSRVGSGHRHHTQRREGGEREGERYSTHLSRASKLLARKNSHFTRPSKALANAESLPFAPPGPRLSLQALPSGFPFLLPCFLRSLSH